jgi:hypothetical protein
MITYSVEDAIKKGHRTVTIPSLLIPFILIIGSYYLSLKEYTLILMPETILLSVVITVIFRGKAITEWRVWAFENVRNVHELQHRAVLSRLIPGKESKILEKLEIWSKADRLRWDELQQKFDKEMFL